MPRLDQEISLYAARFRDGRVRVRPAEADLVALESEAIHIIREAAAQFARPVMLYSIGKDSGVMLHLAMKAFWPNPPPFPLLHVDSRWEFAQMGEFRDRLCAALGVTLKIHVNRDGEAQGIGPFTHGSAVHTDIMRTEALRQALREGQYDCAFGGGRRDEEKSRAKERIFSFRDESQGWDPRSQRAELWNIYNGRIRPGQSMRVFPLSNWTELDVWRYIRQEDIPVVPLYFAAERPVLEHDGVLLMVDDDRFPLAGRTPQTASVRFRTLGCYPLTGGVHSTAHDIDAVIAEVEHAATSERLGRVIDHDESGSMEKKKRQGYF